jgi:hypothetical protein
MIFAGPCISRGHCAVISIFAKKCHRVEVLNKTQGQFKLKAVCKRSALYHDLLLLLPRLCHYSVGVPGGNFVSMNRFSTLCG